MKLHFSEGDENIIKHSDPLYLFYLKQSYSLDFTDNV